MPSCTVNLDLDEELEARLRGLTTSRGASLQQVLEEAVRTNAEREEAFERERDEDDACYREYLRTGEAVDHDEVSVWLDSIGTDNPLPPPHRRG